MAYAAQPLEADTDQPLFLTVSVPLSVIRYPLSVIVAFILSFSALQTAIICLPYYKKNINSIKAIEK